VPLACAGHVAAWAGGLVVRARGLAAPLVVRAAALGAPLVAPAGVLARRPRGPRALAAVLAGLAAALVIGVAVGLGGTGHPARTGPAVPGTAPVPGSGTRAARWLGGPAGRMLSAVSADLGRLALAERSRKPGPVRLAGLRLTADARAALLGPPPPRGARLYRVALTELAQAGRSAASGRLRAAGASLRAGESTITKATAMANSPDTAGVPGAPAREPAGQ
jgi:hypothetical protein